MWKSMFFNLILIFLPIWFIVQQTKDETILEFIIETSASSASAMCSCYNLNMNRCFYFVICNTVVVSQRKKKVLWEIKKKVQFHLQFMMHLLDVKICINVHKWLTRFITRFDDNESGFFFIRYLIKVFFYYK